MTVQELLNHMARASDDSDAAYETAALTWLNLARSDISTWSRWRNAVRVDTFETSAATTDGLYNLTGYEALAEDTLYDVTNECLIQHESKATLEAIDIAKDTTSFPTWWGDAGADDSGARKLYLWPVPAGTYTIRFTGYKVLTDLTSDDTTLSVDPFYGPISQWSNVFQAGMRYYHDLDNNEDAMQLVFQERRFHAAIKRKKQASVLAPDSSLMLDSVRQRNGASRPMVARLDPGHYRN